MHPFGNVCSPAVAIFGLHYAAGVHDEHPDPLHQKARDFVSQNFYVDDGLGSDPTAAKAVATLGATITVLQRHNIILHKILSPDLQVMAAFPPSERADFVQSMDVTTNSSQRP